MISPALSSASSTLIDALEETEEGWGELGEIRGEKMRGKDKRRGTDG